MARLLTLFMILALVTTQGASMAAALCRHDNVQAHIAARQNQDPKIASVSTREEAAASEAAKSTNFGDSSNLWPAKMLPADGAPAPLRLVERLRMRPVHQSALSSVTVIPLLEPPSA
jgi:hypothetical protein